MQIKAQPITDVDHPVDGIGEAGLAEISGMLRKEGVIRYHYEWDDVLDDIGSEWIIKKGKYAGTFPKRLAKSIKARHKKKIDSKILGNLGELAKRHTVEAKGYRIDFTSDFSWRSGDFGDEGSCFWGDYAGARDMIRDAGGLAVRFYDPERDDGSPDKGYGRAWMIPYSKHWIIFNAYGKNLTTITVARILATEMGWSYKKIRLSNNGSYDNVLWINGGLAYIIGETGKIEDIDEIDLDIDEPSGRGQYECYHCGEHMDDYYTVNGDAYCNYCYNDIFFYCERCGEDKRTDDSEEVYYWDGARMQYNWECEYCASEADVCVKCHRRVRDDILDVEGHMVCVECAEELPVCEECGELILTPHILLDYPRNTNGTYANRVETILCIDCHYNKERDDNN